MDWKSKPQLHLGDAIAEFKMTLPGWWYTLGECKVSCHASCAPTVESEDIKLISQDDRFDHGFHADLGQPSTLAEALRDVLGQAVGAKKRLQDAQS